MYGIYYLVLIIVGFFFAYLYGRHTEKFLWREYSALLAAPVLGVGGLTALLGVKPLLIFITASLIGPLLEWLVGFTYHRIMGAHLWVYERYPLPGRYTSYLTIPMWGFAIELLWLLLKDF